MIILNASRLKISVSIILGHQVSKVFCSWFCSINYLNKLTYICIHRFVKGVNYFFMLHLSTSITVSCSRKGYWKQYLMIENSHNNIINMMITISFGFTFVFRYSEVTFLGESSPSASTSVSFIFLFTVNLSRMSVSSSPATPAPEEWEHDSVGGQADSVSLSPSLAPTPVSNRSFISPANTGTHCSLNPALYTMHNIQIYNISIHIMSIKRN